MELNRCRTFSIIDNLNKLESFILHDSTAQLLYQQYLESAYPEERKANHIPFFADMVDLRDNSDSSKQNGTLRAELYVIFDTYIAERSELLLDIPTERLNQVRRNIQRDLTLSAFKPAIKAVVRDLAFIHMDSFINSAIFSEYKERLLAELDFSEISRTSPQEKDSTHKIRKFFGDKFVHTGSSFKSLGDQPKHIKEYKLSKLFGERVGVEKSALLADRHEEEEEEHVDDAQTKRRDRRLHMFFGDNFQVDETLFSARIQASRHPNTAIEFPKQPMHVNNYRLTKFFGERPPTKEDLSDSESSGSESDEDVSKRMHSKTQHLIRFFGERMDPAKEANSVTFASQPRHVKSVTLKKFFGESASHTLNFDVPFGGTWPKARSQKSRAKLEKFFGPFEG